MVIGLRAEKASNLNILLGFASALVVLGNDFTANQM